MYSTRISASLRMTSSGVAEGGPDSGMAVFFLVCCEERNRE
jgi:hypothetical protein